MPRYAQVEQNSQIVVNVIMWDGNTETWAPPSGYEMIEDTEGVAGVGFTWNGETFIPPPTGGAKEEPA